MYLSLPLLPKEVSILKVTIFSNVYIYIHLKSTKDICFQVTYYDLIIDDGVDESIIYALCPSISSSVLPTVFSLSVCTKVACTHALFMCSVPF